MANSMLNLSLSPSSSSTSSTLVVQQIATPTAPITSEWRKSPPIPSLMDQLSKCTFVTTASTYSTVQYPIYPIYSTTTNTDTAGASAAASPSAANNTLHPRTNSNTTHAMIPN
ncbi:hypothetical protein BDF20DRAFT_877277 [Mycotypha africana]|uniref:uncharacterized protein n=1 Tax=Mycotypha africana TaxID=64632 RepID=UPI0023007176|nr:uncharacterized protein BDF20DRAFT_877277 [Mycotypha africana]KAI8975174.1 hypothetical protein BDF20DRAFT_877277 [Mycotypha africana]